MTLMRTSADEERAPKYAHVERERRWLVDTAKCLPTPSDPHIVIEDRYISDSRMRLRRMTDTETGAQSLKLTKKYPTNNPLAGPIVTAYLTVQEYELFATLPATSLVKRRHKIAAGNRTYSVDVFMGAHAGLVLAEIEWPDDAGLRELPDPDFAVSEVTHIAEYQGGHLAARTSEG
jgi:CYTH domain-containing protein